MLNNLYELTILLLSAVPNLMHKVSGLGFSSAKSPKVDQTNVFSLSRCFFSSIDEVTGKIMIEKTK